MNKSKRFVSILTATVLLTGTLAAGTAVTAAAPKITKAKAKQIALDRAGVAKSDVSKWTKISLDNWDDDRQKEWDVEFRTKNYKYEVEVNANSGRVEDFEKEKLRTAQSAPVKPAAKITRTKAKNIVLKEAGVKKKDVKKWVKIHNDGREWEIKFQTADYRYEMDVDISTGNVRDFEKEKIHTASAGQISLEEAKDIALKHAKEKGDFGAEAGFVKAKLDRDDGRAVYEIEIRSGRMEYDCEIDAASGKIVEWDLDYDD